MYTEQTVQYNEQDQITTGSYINLFFHLLLIIPFFIGVACFSFYYSAHANRWYLIVAIQVAACIFLGILHLYISEKKSAYWFSLEKKSSLINTVIFLVTLLILSIVLFTIVNKSLVLLSIAFCAAFFLPTITTYTYRQFLEIPQPEQRVWFQQHNLIDNKSFVFLNSVGVKVKLTRLCNEKKRSVFNVVVPSHMELGKVFHFFIIQQQSEGIEIETTDEQHKPVGWQFFLEKYNGVSLRLLNPDVDLRENGIENSNSIVAERVYAVKSAIGKFQKRLI